MDKIDIPLLLFHNHHFANAGIRPASPNLQDCGARIQFMGVDFDKITITK